MTTRQTKPNGNSRFCVRRSVLSQRNPDSESRFNTVRAATEVPAAAGCKSRNSMTRWRKRTYPTILLAGVLCLGLLRPALAAPGSWTQAADLPSPTSAPVACAVDGILYVIGGHYPYNTALETVWAYHPATNGWTRKADLPIARRFAAAAVVDRMIYVVGGTTGPFPGTLVRSVAVYNPRTDTWTNGANIPTPRALLAACAVDGIIYAIGGTSSAQEFSTVEAYDPTNNVWTARSSLPCPLTGLTLSVVNGWIYAFHGTSTFAYDPQTNRWTAKAHFSPFSWILMSSAMDGIIYLFGGCKEFMALGAHDFALAYDPDQDQFTTRRKMPRTRLGAGCAVIDGRIYLAGGASKDPLAFPDAIYYKVVDVFDPQGGVTPEILSLTCESPNQVRLLWQGEAGIRYGVESRPNVATGAWTRMALPTGTSVLATNSVVETTCTVSTADPKRFFRVLESN